MKLAFFITALVTLQCACRINGGYELRQLVEDTPDQFAEQVISALKELEQHPQVIIKYQGDGIDAGSLQPAVEFLRGINDHIYETYNNAERKQYYRHLKQNLPQSFKKHIFTGPGKMVELLNKEAETGEYTAKWVMEITLMFLFDEDPDFDLRNWFEKDRAIAAFRLIGDDNREGVHYDGVLGRHVYQNDSLREAVYYLTSGMVTVPEEIKKIMKEDAAEFTRSFTENRNDETGGSRIEPADLITNALKFQLLGMVNKNKDNNIQFIGAFAERVYQKFFRGEAADESSPFVVLRDSILDDAPVLLCAGKGFAELVIRGDYSEETRAVKGSSLVQTLELDEVWNMEHRSSDPNVKFFVSCDRKLYQINMEALSIPKVDRPTLNFSKDIHAVSSVALVSEMNEKMLLGGLSYLTLNGYLPEKIQFIDNLKQEFMAVAADGSLDRIILPVGHAFDQRRTELGTSKAIKVVARRKVGNRNVYLHIFLPPLSGGGTSEGLTLDDMKAILCGSNCDGVVKEPGGVAIMTTSCHSSSTLDSWMLAFYQAVETAEQLPTPTVFASDEGYNTDNPFVIVSHLDHIFRFVNGVAEGNSPDEMKQLLSNPLDMTPTRRILAKIAAFAASRSSDASPSEFQNEYSPVCNIDREEYFNAKYKVYDLIITEAQ